MISVITPTYRDWPALQRALTSLEAQSYDDFQHVVVADGPDPELREQMHMLGYAAHGRRMFIELGRNWHRFCGGDQQPQDPSMPGARGGRGSRGVSPALAGTYLAAGDWIGYLDQDCEYGEHHLKLLSEAAAGGIDFVFSRMRRYIDGFVLDDVGDGAPGYGRIDGNVVLHRPELLRTANWRRGGDADWDLIGRWVDAGATWAYVPEVTVHWHHAGWDMG